MDNNNGNNLFDCHSQNEDIPFPHTVDLVPCALLKQRTGSISSHALACDALPSPHWPVWSGFWRALWQDCGDFQQSTSGWSRGKPKMDKDRSWWISAWCWCVALWDYPCVPRWYRPANTDATASTFNCGSTRSPRPVNTKSKVEKKTTLQNLQGSWPKSQSLNEKQKKTVTLWFFSRNEMLCKWTKMSGWFYQDQRLIPEAI